MNLEELRSLYDLTDHTVVVTGGAGVLSSEIACALLACNANILILDRDRELADKVIERFPKIVKGRAVRVYGDVLSVEALQQAIETIKAEFGAVDILINAAGGNHPSATTSAELSFFDLPLDALRRVGDLNLLGTILPCQVFGSGMAERGEGGSNKLHRVVGCAYGAELLAAHTGQRDCTRFFPDGAESISDDRQGDGSADGARPIHFGAHADGTLRNRRRSLGRDAVVSFTSRILCDQDGDPDRWWILSI